MSGDLISRKAAIDIVEKKMLMVGKHDLSAEYKLAGVRDEIKKLNSFDVDKAIKELEGESKYMQSEANDLANVGDYGTATKLEGMAQAYKDCIKIIKSALNQ